jgi:thymidylate synthase
MSKMIVYGIARSSDVGALRYVGVTRRGLTNRLDSHITYARSEKNTGLLQKWMRTVWEAGDSIVGVNLTEIRDQTEREWIKCLVDSGADLINLQHTGGQGKILKLAWSDSEKRTHMLTRDEKLRIVRSAEGVSTEFSRLKIGVNRQYIMSQDVKDKISGTLQGRVFGPHDEERRYNATVTTRLWHRRKIVGAGSADVVWLKTLHDIIKYGEIVSPREQRTLEIRSSLVIVDMSKSVVTIVERKLGYRFLCAEAAWILSGDDRVETIKPYSSTIANFSDDGLVFFGAYGPKILQQLNYVIDTLKRDPSSRQAVINIWREVPKKSHDIPCTLNCQFLIRNNILDVFVSMRSSDVWLGLCYDMMNFSMLGAYVLIELKMKDVQLGSLYNVATSRHLYERDLEQATKCLDNMTVGFRYDALNVSEFIKADSLVDHLWSLAKKAPIQYSWLKEITK